MFHHRNINGGGGPAIFVCALGPAAWESGPGLGFNYESMAKDLNSPNAVFKHC